MYLDSAILIKLVVREPDSEFYVDLIDGQSPVYSSELAITECRSALSRKHTGGELDTRTYRKSWEMLESMWSGGGGVALIPITRTILQKAADIIHALSPKIPLRTLDAIHIVSCQSVRAHTLITNDHIMRKAALKLKIPINRLPAAL